MGFYVNLLNSDLRRTKHQLGRAGRAGLHHHGSRVDIVGLDVLERYTERLGLAGPISEFDPATHHVGVSESVPAVFATADRNGDRLGDRA